MIKTRNIARALCGVVVATAMLGAFYPAHAQGYDTSGIKPNPKLAGRVPADIKQAGVLVAGSDNAYAPWEYLAGADGQTPEGIDIDLGDAIAAKLGLTYESRTAPFTSILPALGVTYDIGVSALSVTKKRMETVNFVHYAHTTNQWVVRAGNPTKFDPAQICGRVIALQSGGAHERLVREENEACKSRGEKEIEILPFGATTEAITRVATGGADATVAGAATGLYAAKQSEGRLEALAPERILNSAGPVGIAVPKNDAELAQLLTDALNELIEDGTYRAIFDHWGIGSMAITKSVINPDTEW